MASANRTIVVQAVCAGGETPCNDGNCAKVCPESLVLTADGEDGDSVVNTAPSVRYYRCCFFKFA